MFLIFLIFILILLIVCIIIKNNNDNFKDIKLNKLLQNKYININDNEKNIYVNYFTGNNIYKKYANNLINSLNKFNLSYYIIEIDSSNYKWSDLILFKPNILLEVLNLYPTKNVIWIDADAKINKYPHIFNNINKSVAVTCRGKNLKCLNLWSCVIFFKNDNISKKIIHDWNVESKRINHKFTDQIALKNIINRKYFDHLQKLPKYFIVKEYDTKNIDKACIVESEASTDTNNI